LTVSFDMPGNLYNKFTPGYHFHITKYEKATRLNIIKVHIEYYLPSNVY
jgi:hypothetical protein